jgi:hypothetical protein
LVRLVFLRKNQGARIGDFQRLSQDIHEACDHPGCVIEVDHGQDITLIIENKSSEETGAATLCLYLYNLGSRWQIENALHANHEEIAPKGSNQADEDDEVHPGSTGRWEELKMEIPQELRMRDQKQCGDVIKVFITVQPTSFTSSELPKLSKQLKLSHPTRIGGAWNGRFSDEWAALNFRLRTSL